jgi:hypothetical protein
MHFSHGSIEIEHAKMLAYNKIALAPRRRGAILCLKLPATEPAQTFYFNKVGWS